jgi:cell division cycle 2-like protein
VLSLPPGCIFAELLLNAPLFNGQSELEQISRILKVLGTPDLDDWTEFADLEYGKTYSFTKPLPHRLRELFPVQSYTGGNVLSDQGYQLLKSLLCYNPSKRLSAAEALQHPYFTESPLPQTSALMPTYPSSNEKVHTGERGPDSGDLRRRREQEASAGGFFL